MGCKNRAERRGTEIPNPKSLIGICFLYAARVKGELVSARAYFPALLTNPTRTRSWNQARICTKSQTTGLRWTLLPEADQRAERGPSLRPAARGKVCRDKTEAPIGTALGRAVFSRLGCLHPRTGVAHEPGAAAAPGRCVGVPSANLQSQGTGALDSLLDAARQGARSAPTPGPGVATDALGNGSLPMTPLASLGPALRWRGLSHRSLH
jgi:hypothetical protein